MVIKKFEGLRIGSIERLLWTQQRTYAFHKCWEFLFACVLNKYFFPC
jgi:hypothetical protein